MTYIEAFPESWLTGISPVDEEHQNLFYALKSMIKHNEKPESCEGPFHDWFLDALKEHFKSEEKVMRENGYPEADEHAAHHIVVYNRLSKLGDGELSESDIANKCLRAFVRDVVVEDIKFKEFLQQNNGN